MVPGLPKVTRERLPTLSEVLSRRTAAPLDLYCYYLFLQGEGGEGGEGSEDTLDFWLDVQQHENLCRAYFKDLRKSGKSLREDWPQYYDMARQRGSIFNNVNGIQKERLSGLDGFANEKGKQSPASFEHTAGDEEFHDALNSLNGKRQPHGSLGVDDPDHARLAQRTPSPTANAMNRPDYSTNLSPTLRAMYPNQDRDHLAAAAEDGTLTDRRRSFGGSGSSRPKTPVQPYIKRDAAITRTDLIASAELIYARYLTHGSEKEVFLPPALRIDTFPISSSQLPNVQHPDYEVESEALARVPDMFHSQKEYVYRQMEHDTFPRFLRAKSFGNLTPFSAMVRLCVGLFSLWVAFSVGFALIFTDTKPKAIRAVVVVPFLIGFLGVLGYCYDLDPILILFFMRSETTPFRTLRIREPYVQRLLFGRALWVGLLAKALAVILTVIFWAVPGHRL